MAKKKFIPPWLKVEDEAPGEKPKGKDKGKPKPKGFVPFGKPKKGGVKKKGK